MSALIVANVSRRRFLEGISALGGLVLAVGYPSAARAQAAKKYGADGMPNGWVDDPLAFVSIADDGIVTIVCHRAEMGQGVRTGMPMIVADELEADWKRVRVVQAPGDEKRFGNQDTDGSRSTRHFFEPMRRCGAAARTMLEAAAAERWKVPVSEVEARNHEVVHRMTGRRLGYGALARAAAARPVPARDSVRLKDPAKFRYIGKGQLKLVDGRDIATGKAQYGIDTRLPGMLYAVVARPPVYGGKVTSVDDAEALKVPGVRQDRPDRGQPAAGALQSARRGRRDRAQHLGGDPGPPGAQDHMGRRPERLATTRPRSRRRSRRRRASRARSCAATATSRRPRPAPRNASRPSTTFRTSPTRRWKPPAATARIANGKCEVWGCFQSPQAARDLVAKRLGMSADDVTVHVTLLGGGFGRKSKPDYAIEAAVLSKAMDGKPVKVTWTRDDDLHNDYFHTVSVEHLEAGVDAQGKPVAWLHRSVAPTIISTFDRRARRRRRRSSSAWASSTCRSPFPTSASRTRRRRLTRGSAGSGRCRTFPTRSRSSRSSPSWPPPPAATPRTSCST